MDLHLSNYHTEAEEHFSDTADIQKVSPENVVDYTVMTLQAEREYGKSVEDHTRAYGESNDKTIRDEPEIHTHETRVKTQPVTDASLEAFRPSLHEQREALEPNMEYTGTHGHESIIYSNCTRGVLGGDVRVIHQTVNTADITKVLGSYIPGLEICTVGALVESLQGPAILIMQQYACAGRGARVYSW